MTLPRVTLLAAVAGALGWSAGALAQPPETPGADVPPVAPEAEPDTPEDPEAEEDPAQPNDEDGAGWWDEGGAGVPPEVAAEPGRGAPDGLRPEADPEPAAGEDSGRDDGADASAEVEEEEDEEDATGRFVFGSYGRVVAASDLDGQSGRDADIVSHGPRIDEGTYAELELRREDDLRIMSSRVVATLALAGPLFHFDGAFEDRFAVRNLFLELSDVGAEGLHLWAGSRMVRGDDLYLFDFWPMDNLNLVGGGLRYAHEELFEAGLSVGLARPDDPFQRQVIDTMPVAGFEPDEVVLLDRPRLVIAAKGTWFALGRGDTGLKLSLYGEVHDLSAGERQDAAGVAMQLPADSGWVFGAQVGGWLSERNAFVNLFLRYARGLGAYDPLGVPFRTGSVIDTERAEELLVALSANFEWEMVGAQLGAWVRRFRDADPSLLERGALAEGALSIRPYVWLGEHLGLAVEGGYQALETTALDERTGEPVRGSIWKFGLIPFVSPFGRGTYTRPHLRIIYALTRRDAGARALYPDRDPRSLAENSTEHFLGVGAEWWFDSSSYQ